MDVLPFNLDAEASILGSILIDNKSINSTLDKINSDDFYSSSNKYIYESMLKLYKKKIAIDEITLSQNIGKENLKSIGGITYILKLKQSTPNAKHIKNYISIVKDSSNKRKLILAMQEALQNIHEKDTQEVIKDLSKSFVDDNTSENQVYNMEQIIESSLNYIENAYKNGGKIVGMSTGFDIYDKYSNGIKKQEISIIAARPSMGKTAFSLNAIHHLSQEKKVMMFQLEMGVNDIGTRMLAAAGFINALDLQQGKLQDKDWNKISRISAELSKSNFILDTTGGLSWNQIEARIRKEKFQNGLDVVFIDHIGLIKVPNKNRNIEIGEITTSAKALAKELDIAIVFLCQLNRGCEQRADKRPILSDLRDSGNIEQDSDLITFIYRDEYYNAETEDQNIMELIIAKNRNGMVGTVKVAYLKECQLIANIDNIHS
ncbi:replicative DNA helicase [Clostridium brassicae]|uniref:Replicative DNA helicase n=1 Tax=Clostridium brassicae TaxID=2999072 RepID=A0ABT4D9B4_9CLOT|nr:replicative DNA helicase [Clostridium brassicae]MCY6957831.1 replicative DNA helicase [Clostridium brassicae]